MKNTSLPKYKARWQFEFRSKKFSQNVTCWQLVYIAISKVTRSQPENSSSNTARPQVITSGKWLATIPNELFSSADSNSRLLAQILTNSYQWVWVDHILSETSCEKIEIFGSLLFIDEWKVLPKNLSTQWTLSNVVINRAISEVWRFDYARWNTQRLVKPCTRVYRAIEVVCHCATVKNSFLPTTFCTVRTLRRWYISHQ